MGKEVRGVPEAAPLTKSGEGDAPAPSIGLYLAQQRRLRGISLDDLADRTKIPRRSLERLESGAFDLVADGFARGFVRTVAEALGLDADEAVMRLLTEPPDHDAEIAVQQARTRRLIFAAGALAVGLAAGFGFWVLRAALGGPFSEPEAPELVYRRDAVRSLQAHEARAQRAEDERGGRITDRSATPAGPPDRRR